MYIYSVTPESVSPHDTCDEDFRTRLTRTAQASESAGWSGILVPHNLHELDPWILAAYLGSVTDRLVPLIAVQPASIPPHMAASCAAAYAMLYGRPLHFNLVAGARDDEMRRIGDTLDHDQRYERLREYGRTLRALLDGEKADVESDYYTYRKFRLEPRPEVLAQCRLFMAGSSPASLSVAAEIADVVVTHPEPFPEWQEKFLRPLRAAGYRGELAIRVGIVCRPNGEEAWSLAEERFPQTWLGRQETLLKTQSQNSWSRGLAERVVAEDASPQDGRASRDVYWLGAFRSGRASAPFLVGDYDEVASRLGDYTGAGVGHVLLNGVHDDDYGHTREGLLRAAAVGR